jgi:signal transduction histidine kinase
MTSMDTVGARRRGGTLTTALQALWSARSWRATLHALLGAPLAVGACAVIAGLVVVWLAAVWSLAEGPTGGRLLAVLYVVVAVAGPVALPWCVLAFGAVQRARFRTVLGVEIAAPPRVAGRWPLRLVRPWRAPATWRQLGYHLLALVVGAVGGALVAICWSAVALAPWYADDLWSQARRPGIGLGVTVLTLAMLLAAPWVARGLARVDGAAARALLGASRSEELALRVEALARSRAEIVAATDAERRRIERDLHDGAQQRLVSCSPSVEAVAYFVVSEALTNVAKHAHAGHAEVSVERTGDRLRVVVNDDGRGGATLDAGGEGSGLRGLAQRAAAVDGTLTIDSPPGGPTTITVELPCES